MDKLLINNKHHNLHTAKKKPKKNKQTTFFFCFFFPAIYHAQQIIGHNLSVSSRPTGLVIPLVRPGVE